MALTTDDEHHFYGAWHGPRRTALRPAGAPATDVSHIIKGRAAFAAEGGRIEEPVGESLSGEQLSRAQGSWQDIKDTMPSKWPTDTGPQFTRIALTVGRDNPVAVAWKGSDLAGAAAYEITTDNTGQRSLHISMVGTTGIAEGAGSAFFANLVRKAAAAGAYIKLEAIPTAMPFWLKMGMRPAGEVLPGWVNEDYGIALSAHLAMSAAEVRRLASTLWP